MILPNHNQYLAKQYFETLPNSDISHKFYSGEKYETPKSLLGRLYNSFFIQQKLSTLQKFYPYQKTVRATVVEQNYDIQTYIKNSLIFTAVAWTSFYQLARRGFVFPVLKEYGKFYQTHRLFRHYLYSATLPLIYSFYHFQTKWYTHVEHLWIVHANRLNSQILEDPVYTYYPANTQPKKRFVNIKPIFRDHEGFGPNSQTEEEDEE